MNFVSIRFSYGRIQSIKIDEQHLALITFLDIGTALKAHHAENILDKRQLRTEFYDDSSSPGTSSIIEPSSSSPSSITTVTNTLTDKTIISTHEDRNKRIPRISYNSEKNTRLVDFFSLVYI